MERAKIVAEGDVQGVGYRYYVRRLAWRLDLKGYVTNLPDGRVEVVVEGEKSKIEEFIKAINIVRPPINVTKLSVEYQKPTGKFTTFKIKTGTLREELVEGFSTGASYFEIMFTKQDQMLAKQDQMLAKQDQMLALQKQTLDEVKALRADLKTILDERLKAIERDLTLIKAKLNL
ncbi:MAG: acylphosphatase [Nitrososphaerota archaeon]|nr:acylphosphatase [Nitrososphaerales archaeon]MDW8044400.1 acylphosphatase [Nitrososphaerota archaeon]